MNRTVPGYHTDKITTIDDITQHLTNRLQRVQSSTQDVTINQHTATLVVNCLQDHQREFNRYKEMALSKDGIVIENRNGNASGWE